MDAADPRQQARVRDAQRLVNAYHRVFRSEDGRIVLADLEKVFGIDKPAHLPGAKKLPGFLRDGQRSVFCHIQHILKLEPLGEINAAEEARAKVVS